MYICIVAALQNAYFVINSLTVQQLVISVHHLLVENVGLRVLRVEGSSKSNETSYPLAIYFASTHRPTV